MLIDVSNHQGTINWAAADPAIDGAYVKVTEGTGYVDPFWRRNHDAVMVGGRPCGAYHFADLGDPVAEADYFAGQYMQATWQLRPVLDIETSGASAGWITAFRDRFRARTGTTLFRVYTSRSFLQGALDPAGWIDGDTDIWMAAYSSTPGWDHPALHLWQNTDSATIPGALGNVDADQYMNGWTPAADQGGDLTPELEAMIRDLHEQAFGNGSRSSGNADGWALLPATVPGASYSGPPLTPVDFLRQIHRELLQRLPNRVDGKSTETLAGNAANGDAYGYKAGQALAAVQATLAAIQGALSKEEADLLGAFKGLATGTVDVNAFAAALIPLLPKGISADDIVAALAEHLATPATPPTK